MNTRMIAVALLMSGVCAPLMAQDAPPSPSADSVPPGVQPPAPQPPVSQPPAAGSVPADPNAGELVGAVPPTAATMAPADPSVPANPAAPVGSAANPVVVGGNLTAPPPSPKDYPVCTKTITDSCVNRGEAKKSRKH